MKILAVLFLSLTTAVAHAGALTGSYNGPIMGIRVEADAALISLTHSLQDADPPCSRIWLDLKLEEHQAAYSLFMMAFVSDMDVLVRARRSSSNRRFGACALYDVFVGR